jgi:hypothetical protein
MIPIKDLRIGDLVKTTTRNPILEKGSICKVVLIDALINSIIVQKNDVDVCRCLVKEEIEGIRLTPDILEKNGWEQEYYAPIIYGHIGHDIEISFLQTSKRCSVLLNDISLCEIQYVHQLQHILWVLGEDANLII